MVHCVYQIGCNMCLTLVWASSYNLYGGCVVITCDRDSKFLKPAEWTSLAQKLVRLKDLSPNYPVVFLRRQNSSKDFDHVDQIEYLAIKIYKILIIIIIF